MNRLILIFSVALFVTSCAATRSSSKVKENENISVVTEATLAAEIIITEEDILDREYVTLGDINVSVSKTTIFNKDPTNEMVAEKLKVEASKLGADAVILVRYGTVGVSMMSWGKLDGNGRAIKFVD